MKVITTLLIIYLIITAMSIILSIAEAIRQVAYELDNEENKIKEDDFFDIFLRCCLYIFCSLMPGFNLYITMLLILRILGFTDQSTKINW
nr:hypothetical protein [Clostridium neonatale]